MLLCLLYFMMLNSVDTQNYLLLHAQDHTVQEKVNIVFLGLDTQNQGVKNIGRWTQFCDPLKKKNGMNSLDGIS